MSQDREAEQDPLMDAISRARSLAAEWQAEGRRAAARADAALHTKPVAEVIRETAWSTAYECHAADLLAALAGPGGTEDPPVTIAPPGGGPMNAGLNRPGKLLCDFCGADGPVCYFPCKPFTLVTSMVTGFDSGDRFYACPPCRKFVEADDWAGLRDYCAAVDILQTVDTQGVRMLWAGFRQHRAGAVVEFAAGTNPEAGR